MQDFFEFVPQKEGCIVKIKGIWDFKVPKNILESFEKNILPYRHVFLDFAEASRVDFNAISFILLTLQKANISYEIGHAAPGILVYILNFETLHSPLNTPDSASIIKPVDVFSKYLKGFCNDVIDFFNFSGLLLYYLYLTCLNPSRFRWRSFIYHINESGFRALPVALLTAFIVGGAISLQGAIQLQSMGAPLLSIDTTAKLSLREMGPFILALVIAGRSSSSYTAQIGVMNITDEINAMRVMNFSLMEFLVLPRFLALVVVMPLMVFLADAASIFAGMLAIKAQLGISFLQYAERFYESVGWSHFILGIIKAPFFGAAIAMVGCFRGLQVYGDTEQIGKATTTSVVNTLFWCIFINAVFSIIFTRLDL